MSDNKKEATFFAEATAPTDLSEGDHLMIRTGSNIDDTRFVVVPEGGARKGDTFAGKLVPPPNRLPSSITVPDQKVNHNHDDDVYSTTVTTNENMPTLSEEERKKKKKKKKRKEMVKNVLCCLGLGGSLLAIIEKIMKMASGSDSD